MELVALGKEQTKEGGTERHMHVLSICKSFQLTLFPVNHCLSYTRVYTCADICASTQPHTNGQTKPAKHE